MKHWTPSAHGLIWLQSLQTPPSSDYSNSFVKENVGAKSRSQTRTFAVTGWFYSPMILFSVIAHWFSSVNFIHFSIDLNGNAVNTFANPSATVHIVIGTGGATFTKNAIGIQPPGNYPDRPDQSKWSIANCATSCILTLYFKSDNYLLTSFQLSPPGTRPISTNTAMPELKPWQQLPSTGSGLRQHQAPCTTTSSSLRHQITLTNHGWVTLPPSQLMLQWV